MTSHPLQQYILKWAAGHKIEYRVRKYNEGVVPRMDDPAYGIDSVHFAVNTRWSEWRPVGLTPKWTFTKDYEYRRAPDSPDEEYLSLFNRETEYAFVPFGSSRILKGLLAVANKAVEKSNSHAWWDEATAPLEVKVLIAIPLVSRHTPYTIATGCKRPDGIWINERGSPIVVAHWMPLPEYGSAPPIRNHYRGLGVPDHDNATKEGS